MERRLEFVVHNTLEGPSSHLLVVPVLAFTAGVAGAWIAAFLPKFGYVARYRYRASLYLKSQIPNPKSQSILFRERRDRWFQ